MAAAAAHHWQQKIEPLAEPPIVQRGLHRGRRLLDLCRRSAWQRNGGCSSSRRWGAARAGGCAAKAAKQGGGAAGAAALLLLLP